MLNRRQSELRGLVALRLPMRSLCALACRIGAFVVAVVWIAASRSADANQPLTGVAQLDVGGFHACAVTAYGGVQCWGANLARQLANGRSDDSQMASDVIGLWTGLASVATGDRHTCAVTMAGGVKCWGDNEYEQLGVEAENKSVRFGIQVSRGLLPPGPALTDSSCNLRARIDNRNGP